MKNDHTYKTYRDSGVNPIMVGFESFGLKSWKITWVHSIHLSLWRLYKYLTK